MFTVNGELVSRERIRDQAARLRQQYRQREGRGLTLEEEAAVFSEAEQILVDQVLLEQHALGIGLDVSEAEIEQALSTADAGTRAAYTCMDAGVRDAELKAEVRSHLLRQKLLRSLPDSQPPSRREVSDFYKRHRQSFWTPELIRVSQVVKNVDDTADAEVIEREMQAIHEELMQGADFAVIAAARSDCGSPIPNSNPAGARASRASSGRAPSPTRAACAVRSGWSGARCARTAAAWRRPRRCRP